MCVCVCVCVCACVLIYLSIYLSKTLIMKWLLLQKTQGLMFELWTIGLVWFFCLMAYQPL